MVRNATEVAKILIPKDSTLNANLASVDKLNLDMMTNLDLDKIHRLNNEPLHETVVRYSSRWGLPALVLFLLCAIILQRRRNTIKATSTAPSLLESQNLKNSKKYFGQKSAVEAAAFLSHLFDES